MKSIRQASESIRLRAEWRPLPAATISLVRSEAGNRSPVVWILPPTAVVKVPEATDSPWKTSHRAPTLVTKFKENRQRAKIANVLKSSGPSPAWSALSRRLGFVGIVGFLAVGDEVKTK